MVKVKLKTKAQATMTQLSEKNREQFFILKQELYDLEEKRPKINQIKNIGGGIFRKRSGRRRILFTVENDISVWIIAIEKDTKKDYKLWTDYIKSQL